MPDENRNDEKNSKKNGEFKFSLRGYILWTAMLGAVLVLMFFRANGTAPGDLLDQAVFMQKVKSNLIARATITYDPQSPYLRDVKGKYFKTDAEGNKVTENGKPDGKPVEIPFVAKPRMTDKMEQKILDTG